MVMHIPYNALELARKESSSSSISIVKSEPKPVTDICAVVSGPEVVRFDRIMELFHMCKHQAAESFIRDNPHLEMSWNEMATIYFLRITYSDSMKTIRSYARFLCKYSEYLSVVNIHRFDMVTPEDITNYREALRSTQYKPGRFYRPNTINSYMAILKSFYDFLFHTRELSTELRDNPTWVIKRRIQAEAKKSHKTAKGQVSGHTTKSLTKSQVEQLFSIIRKEEKPTSERNHVLLQVLYKTAIRSIEAMRLTWEELYTIEDPRKWYIHVYGKGAKDRQIYVPYPVVEMLMVMRERIYSVPPFVEAPGLEGVPVFSQQYDKYTPLAYDTIYGIVRNCGELAELEFNRNQKRHAFEGKPNISPHWLRHTFATHAREAGFTDKQIQLVLGHENTATSAKYGMIDERIDPIGAKMFG